MTPLWEFVLRHGYGLAFATVLVEQLGAPVPAIPVLLVLGALSGLGHYSIFTALLAALAAALVADTFWFELGRRRGDSILALLCRLSLEPDTCVKQTSSAFERYGPATLLFAKFVPGLSTVAPPLAGSGRVSTARFLAFDAAGTLLWAGSALGAGFLLRREVEKVTAWLSRFGAAFLLVAGFPLLAWIAFKYFQRRRTLALLRVARISPRELKTRLDSALETHIVDLRSPTQRRRSASTLPGALALAHSDLDVHLKDLPRGAHLVFYCS